MLRTHTCAISLRRCPWHWHQVKSSSQRTDVRANLSTTTSYYTGTATTQTIGAANGRQQHHQPLDDRLRGQVPKNIWAKTNANLHTRHTHPLDTIRRCIESYMHEKHPSLFVTKTDVPPLISVTECFDDLLVPSDHCSRKSSDTFYCKPDTILRPHMTAHDPALLRANVPAALLCGDVYRRDTVDRTHYPVFHQLDAYRLYPATHGREAIEHDLKNVLENLGRHLFGNEAQLRWVDAYFPFTTPSFELEVFWKGDWLEVLGCGLLHRGVLHRTGIPPDVDGWAFGLGLERLAMVLFDIPDIRLFWSSDERFLNQFRDASLQQTFKPFSVYPGVEKHISFWLDGQFHDNDLYQIVRAVGGDLVESVSLIDRFERGGRTSLCFSMIFRSLERSLTHVEINEIYDMLREKVATALPVSLR